VKCNVVYWFSWSISTILGGNRGKMWNVLLRQVPFDILETLPWSGWFVARLARLMIPIQYKGIRKHRACNFKIT